MSMKLKNDFIPFIIYCSLFFKGLKPRDYILLISSLFNAPIITILLLPEQEPVFGRKVVHMQGARNFETTVVLRYMRISKF